MNKSGKILGVSAVLIAAFLVLGLIGMDSASSMESTREGVLQVIGESTLYAKPDRARIVLGVETHDESAQKAAADNAKIADQVIKALKAKGLEDDQISTGAYHIYGQREPIDLSRGKQEFLLIYRAYNEIIIETRKLDEVGQMIDTAVKSGANQVQAVNFDISDPEALKLQALQGAIIQAGNKAGAMSKSARVEILGIKTITEDRAYYFPYKTTFSREMDTVAYTDTPIMPGEVSVEARVVMEYYIK